MSILRELLQDIPIPQMVRIRQNFDDMQLKNPKEALQQELLKPGTMDRILPGQQVAVAVGSRGIANIDLFTKITIDAIKAAGAHPFIVPCMGSHGGATAPGQTEV